MARLDPTGVSRILTYIKTWITGLLSNKSDSSHTHSDYVPRSGGGCLTGVTFNRTTDNSYLSICGSTDWDNGAAIALNGKDRTDNNGFVKIRAKDGSHVTELVLKPDGTATWGGTAISLAGHTHTKANITDFPTIPSKTSQLTNDSGFLTSHQSLSNYSTLANTIKSLSISGKTITYTKGDNSTGTLTTQDNNTWTAMVGATSSANGSVGYVNAVPPKDGYNTKYLRADGTWQVPPDHTYTVNNATLTIQKNGSNVATFTSNASSNVTCNITVPTNTNQLTNGNGFITSSGSCASCTTAGQVSTSVAAGSTKALVYSSMADNDQFRILVGGSSNAGYVEIATSDDGNEPIYVRQYNSGTFGKVVRTLTLLDGSGNTSFPGTVTATTFTGNVTGNCSGTAGGVAWNNVSGKPSTFTPSSHTHTKSQITDFPTIPTVNNATLTIQKNGTTVKTFTANASSNVTCNITVPTKTSELTNNSGFLTSHQSLSGYVPRSGGAVMTGNALSRAINYDELRLDGGTGWGQGASVVLSGKDRGDYTGYIRLVPQNGSTGHTMTLVPDGGWVWDGAACQVTSDQRLKQQISNIDDKLLDAWEDVLPCQFKYNEAVEQKGDTARLHTGYVVQQIDEACKSHNLDISAYGLYCHEEYPERTEEVEVKQDDGSIIKETKVLEPAKEYYSLRYTEALIVECAYLRREVKRLSERLEKLEK